MWFSSLFFSYVLIRKQGSHHEVLVNLPKSWLWKPVTYRAVGLDSDYVVRYDNVNHINKDRLRFFVPDGWTLNVVLYYKGWFGALRTKELNICVPQRIKGVTGLTYEVLRMKKDFI